MPRRLLRDGRIVVDDWQYLGETGAPESPAALIVSLRPPTTEALPLCRS